MKNFFWFLVIIFIGVTQNFFIQKLCNAGGFRLEGPKKKKQKPTSKPTTRKSILLAKNIYQNTLPNEFKFAGLTPNNLYAIVINGDNTKNSKKRHQNNVAFSYNYFMSIGMKQENICLIGYQDLITPKIEPTIHNIIACLKQFGKKIASTPNNTGLIIYLTGHGNENEKKESVLALEQKITNKTELLSSSYLANLMRIYIPAKTFVVYIGDQCYGYDFPKYLEKMYFQGLGFSLTQKNTGFCEQFAPTFWQNMIDGYQSFARGLYDAFKNYLNERKNHDNNIPTIKYFPQSLNVGQINYGAKNTLPIPKIDKVVHSIYKRSYQQIVAIEFTLTNCHPCKILKKQLPTFLFGYNGKIHWVRVTMPDNKTKNIIDWLSRTISNFPQKVSAFPTIFLIDNGEVVHKTHNLKNVANYLDLQDITADSPSWNIFPKITKKQITTKKTQRFNWISNEEFANYKKYNSNFSISDVYNLKQLKITPKNLFNTIDVFSSKLTYNEIKFIETTSYSISKNILKKLKDNNVPVELWKYASSNNFNIKLLLSYYQNLDRIKSSYEHNNYVHDTIILAVESNIPYTIFIGFPKNMSFNERHRLYTNYRISGWLYQKYPVITNELLWIMNKCDSKSILYIILLMLISFLLGSKYQALICWFKIRSIKKEIHQIKN